MAQCSQYIATKESQGTFIGNWKRCPNRAEVWLLDPEGKDVPGCYLCMEHANACITEYEEKLHQTWTTRPLTKYERI